MVFADLSITKRGFQFIKDDGRNESLIHYPLVLGLEESVNVYMQPYSTQDNHDYGKLIIDCGTLALLRKKGNILSLQGFSKEKKDLHLPDVVIPLDSIYDINFRKLKSMNKSYEKCWITIVTKHSLNTTMTELPMKLTLKMSKKAGKNLVDRIHVVVNIGKEQGATATLLE